MQGVQEKPLQRQDQNKYILALHKPGTYSVFANHQFNSHCKILQERTKCRVNQARAEALCLSIELSRRNRREYSHLLPHQCCSVLGWKDELHFILDVAHLLPLALLLRLPKMPDRMIFLRCGCLSSPSEPNSNLFQESNPATQLLLAAANAAWQGKRWKCLVVPSETLEFPRSWMPFEQNCARETWEI